MAQYDSALVSKSKRKSRKFSEIDLNFTRNTITSDIIKVEDVIAVKRSVKNLVQTNFYERPFQPELGCGVRELLFEQYTEDLSSRIQEEIQEAISTWLPYINIASVNIIQSDEDPNTTSVDIDFSLNYEPDRFESITLNLGGDSESTSTSGGGGY